MPSYLTIPSQSKWRSDSSVAFAVRGQDIILERIDKLIGLYRSKKANYKDMVIACDLFFTIDYWLKTYNNNPRMEKGRLPQVQALYACVVKTLCSQFQCTVNTLPRELELMFGRELTGGGAQVDFEQRRAWYMTREEASELKLRFKNGKAYQYPWWDPFNTHALVLAESSHSAAAMHPGDDVTSGFGFFTMSMSRDIYMTKHEGGKSGSEYGIYHSSYLAGGTAMCAGSMLIEAGVIKKIRSDSGHYQPKDTNMLTLLQALRMFAVPIDDIKVLDYRGTTEVDTATFYANNYDWNKMADQRDNTLKDNQNSFARKPQQDMSKAPDPRTTWARPTPPLKTGNLKKP